MFETKLISVRVDVDTLAEIDNTAYSDRYLTRSDIIQKALGLAAWMCKNGKVHKLLHFSPNYDTVDKFEFEYHREHRLLIP